MIDSQGSLEDQLAALTDLTWQDWVWAGAIFVLSLVAARIVGRLVRRALERSSGGLAVVVLVRMVSLLVVAIGLVLSLQRLGVEVNVLLGALGLFGLAVALAFQNILENFVAGGLLLVKRPFTMGDGIGTNGHVGEVVDFSLRSVTLRRQDGVTVHIPNSSVINEPLENYSTTGRRRTSLEVGVAYGTDLERAQSAILDAVNGVEYVHDDPPAEAWVHQFGASSIDFSIEFFHDPSPDDEEEARHHVAVAVHKALAAAGIEIPFPQRVIHTVVD